MTKAVVFMHGVRAGILEKKDATHYEFYYDKNYNGPPISLTMSLKESVYEFDHFPPFFEGLLPEGAMLEALLRIHKLDRHDYFGQLLKVGKDVIGAVTIIEDHQ